MRPLWTLEEICHIMAAAPLAHTGNVQGISIDSRSLKRDDLFFALMGAHSDGHAYVEQAIAKGASAAVIARDREGEFSSRLPLVIVDDVLQALQKLGIKARARNRGKIIAVTGSVGKTSTKEALKDILSATGVTHAAPASFNNHLGVPITLALMPDNTDFGIFEIGMNHAGEIRPLSEMVRPHIAIITLVAGVHLAHFNNETDIAHEKAEIFSGLEPGGIAILNGDNTHFSLLAALARDKGIDRIFSFGKESKSDARLINYEQRAEYSQIEAEILGKKISYKLGAAGEHLAINTLGALLAATQAGADLQISAQALGRFQAVKGRGARQKILLAQGYAELIDESYNANPVSMAAAITVLGSILPPGGGRRIAVLGDMLELGESARELHRNLKQNLEAAKIDVVFAAGALMAECYECLSPAMRGEWRESAEALTGCVTEILEPGDVVMIKGSLGSKIHLVARALQNLENGDLAS